MLLAITCSSLSVSATYIYPYEIKFDHDNESCASDAITVVNADRSPAVVPEWKYYTYSNNVAFVRGQSTRTIKVRFNTNCPVSDLTISIETDAGTSMGQIINFTIPNYTPLSWVEIPLNGSLPNYVGKHYSSLKWTISLDSKASGYADCNETRYTQHYYYTTYAAPLDLYPEFPPIDITPQLNVLDYACTWASGESDVEGIYTSILNNGFNEHYVWKMNCSHLTSDFYRMGRALGIAVKLHRWSAQEGWNLKIGDMIRQKTNYMNPIGGLYHTARYIFGFHQWVEVDGVQIDPSVGETFNNTWGEYEDYLYYGYVYKKTAYEEGYQENQTGQGVGCEAPAHRYYDGTSANLWGWIGPNK